MNNWPAPIIRLYLGQLTMEAVLAAADDPDASIKKGHVCEVSSVAIPQNWLSPLMQLSEHFALALQLLV
jgi:hypothetical protein